MGRHGYTGTFADALRRSAQSYCQYTLSRSPSICLKHHVLTLLQAEAKSGAALQRRFTRPCLRQRGVSQYSTIRCMLHLKIQDSSWQHGYSPIQASKGLSGRVRQLPGVTTWEGKQSPASGRAWPVAALPL